MTEILIALVALLLGVALGWFVAGRQLAALRAEAALHRETIGRSAVEIEMQQKRLAALEGAEQAREVLANELAAIKASQSERDRAHAAELARLQETFGALAGKALEAAQTKLAESAEQLMARHREAAGAGLEANRNQLAELIAPVKDTLVKYESRLGEVEAARNEAYGNLKAQLANVVLGQERVSGAAAKLETALRSSGKVAGRWGEEQCRNVLEAAGLVEGIDFETQWSVDG